MIDPDPTGRAEAMQESWRGDPHKRLRDRQHLERAQDDARKIAARTRRDDATTRGDRRRGSGEPERER